MTDISTSTEDFRYFDGVTSRQISREFAGQKKALSEAERYSLVKRSKSRTLAKPVASSPIRTIDDLKLASDPETISPGMFTVMQYREWSDEYRIRTRVETSLTKPPLADGARYSDMLTTRGARKITESCYYMAKCHGGYKTFVTGTFTQEIREKIQQSRATIQREVSRTMNTMQKMFQRGWTDSAGQRVKGHDEQLAYCWVVEIPLNANGEENPQPPAAGIALQNAARADQG